MKAIKRKEKVKGTVLFTVVSVMMVMVVFLMSTLVLTTAAQKRTYYTYFQRQAQYAAQSALDTINSRLFGYQKSDSDTLPADSFYEWITNIEPGEENAQELVLQYNVSADTPSGSSTLFGLDGDGTVVDAEGNVVRRPNTVVCRFEKLPEKAVFWNDVYSKMEVQDQWKVTATAVVGQGRNQAEYTLCNYIVDNREQLDESDILQNDFNGSGLQLDRFERETESGRRVDHDVNPTEAGYSVYTFSSVSGASADNMAAMGSRMSGANTYPAVAVTRDGSGMITNRAYPDSTSGRSNDPLAAGMSTYVGSVFDNTSEHIFFQRPSEGFVVYGNYKLTNGQFFVDSIMNPGPAVYQNCGYVYVDGKFEMQNQIKVNQSNTFDQPVNFYLGSMKLTNKDATWGNLGDLYLYDPYQASEIKLNDNTHLAEFIDQNIHKTDNRNWGTITCNNASLTLQADGNNMTINGDFYFTNPNGTLIIPAGKQLTVNGKFFCAGTISGTVVASDQVTTDTLDTTGYPNDYVDQLNSLLGADTAEKFDFRGIPFDNRKDEIFDVYVRWDLGCATEGQALDYIYSSRETPAEGAENGLEIDPEIAESRSAGHAWGVKAYTVDGVTGRKETKYFPYTTPKNASNSFINELSLIPASDYIDTVPTDLDEFAALVGTLPTYDFLTNRASLDSDRRFDTVSVYSHDYDGNACIDTVNNAFVVTESCVIDLDGPTNNGIVTTGDQSINNMDYTFFVDPSQHTGTPIVLILKGTKHNGQLTIITNNTADYSNGYNVDNGATLTPYYESGKFAGRQEVMVFLQATEDDGGNNGRISDNTVTMICSGAYHQFIRGNKKLSIVSNPYYPGDDDFDSMDTTVRYAFEMVPNMVIYGEEGVSYTTQNGATLDAVLKMPGSSWESKAGNVSQGFNVRFREFPEDFPVDTSAMGLSSKNILGMGSISVKELKGQNIALYAYLGDMNRPYTEYVPGNTGQINAQINNSGSDDKNVAHPGYGDFIVDHQGAH